MVCPYFARVAELIPQKTGFFGGRGNNVGRLFKPNHALKCDAFTNRYGSSLFAPPDKVLMAQACTGTGLSQHCFSNAAGVQCNPCTASVCREVALAHQGIVLQPDFLVSDALASGQLVPLLPDFDGEEIGVYVVYPSRQHLSVKVRVLVDFLVAALAEVRWAGA